MKWPWILVAASLLCGYGQPLRAAMRLEGQARATQTSRGAAPLCAERPSAPPLSASVLINLGVCYARHGLYSQAALAYKRAIKIDPHSIPAWTDLGLAYFKAGQFSAAVPPLRQVLEYDPPSFQARTLLAMSYYSLSDFGPASDQLEILMKAEPNNSTLQYLLAESYFHAHEKKPLLDLLHRLLLNSPNSPTVHMLVGEALDRLGRTAEAIEQIKAAELEAPDAPAIHFALGYLYWEQRRFTLAAPEFQREIDLNGNRAQAEAYLADISIRGGSAAKARLLAQDAVRDDPNCRLAYYDLGVIDFSQKRYAQAEGEFKRAIVLDPNRADAYYRLAQIYRLESKTDLERRMLQKFSEIHGARRATLMDEISGSVSREPRSADGRIRQGGGSQEMK